MDFLNLTGAIAPDFNNLFTGILGSLDLLERRLTSAGWTMQLLLGETEF